jgi:hypothetical protein
MHQPYQFEPRISLPVFQQNPGSFGLPHMPFLPGGPMPMNGFHNGHPVAPVQRVPAPMLQNPTLPAAPAQPEGECPDNIFSHILITLFF